jgi:hypothetical protein
MLVTRIKLNLDKEWLEINGKKEMGSENYIVLKGSWREMLDGESSLYMQRLLGPKEALLMGNFSHLTTMLPQNLYINGERFPLMCLY